MSATYTPGETSKMLGIPGSSLRRYVSRFGDYLSPEASRKRGRLFTETDLAILSRIRDLAAQGVSLDNVGDQLAGVVDSFEEPERNLALPGLLKQLDNLTQRQDEQDARYQALQDKVLQIEREMRKPWWKRLFGR